LLGAFLERAKIWNFEVNNLEWMMKIEKFYFIYGIIECD